LILIGGTKLNGIIRAYIRIDMKDEYVFYEGENFDGMMNGFGRLIDCDGAYYNGEFKNGLF